MTLQELGLVLKAEREKRGQAIDEVAGRLKISARILRALEEGDEDSLPHTVYVRGFVRSYAIHLGLDSDELQRAIDPMEAEEQDVAPVAVYSPPDPSGRRSGGTTFFLVFLVLCGIGLAFVWINRDADLFSELQQARLTTAKPAPPLTPSSVAQPTEMETAKTTVSTGAEAVAKPQQALMPETPVVKEKTEKVDKNARKQNATQPVANATLIDVTLPRPNLGPGTQAVQSEQIAQAGQTAQAGQIAQAGQALPQTGQTLQTGQSTEQVRRGDASSLPVRPTEGQSSPSAINGPHKIIITALAECWIHSNADSTDTRQFSLRKGDTFALTFSNKLVLKLGNAGGVRIRYNGQDLPAQGREGQVKVLTFPTVD